MMKMNERNRSIARLRYLVSKYQSVGNGFMCQQLNAQIRRLADGCFDLSSVKN